MLRSLAALALVAAASLPVGLCRRVGAGSETVFAKLPWMLTLPAAQANAKWAYADPASPAGYRVRTALYVSRSSRPTN